MKKIAIIAILATAGLSTNALAQDDRQEARQGQAQEQTEEDAERKAELEEVVCRTERVTGSLTRVNRTCLTRREWNLMAERTRREVGRLGNEANRTSAQDRAGMDNAGAF